MHGNGQAESKARITGKYGRRQLWSARDMAIIRWQR